ncbi:MAG TPA: rRNA maturation RNase YbeY [Dongiaceae bacterium]|nr:rRNA maturation RNase YbeY [Dongiaceae bacterium]
MATKRRATGKREPTDRSIAIENRQGGVKIDLASLEKFFREIVKETGLRYPPAAVCLITDREMAVLNGKYRGKNRTTDVLSFPSEERAKPKSLGTAAAELRREFLGDIAISPKVARKNAKQFGRTMEEEIRVLLLHGILHLMGYDHESDRGEMGREEAKLRRRLRLE